MSNKHKSNESKRMNRYVKDYYKETFKKKSGKSLYGDELKATIKIIDSLLEYHGNSLSDTELSFLSDNYRRYENLMVSDKEVMFFSHKQLMWLDKLILKYLDDK